MKKIALYPYDISNLHLLLYNDFLNDLSADEFICIAPKGWGYKHEDAGKKIGIHTGIMVNSNFEEAIEDADVVIITESIFPLSNSMIIEKIEKALNRNKEVFVLRSGDDNYHDEIKRLEKVNDRLTIYSGNNIKINGIIENNKMEIEEIPVPIVMVIGSGERCCKFDVQLEVRKMLLKKGYKVSQIGSKQYCELLGFHSFPQFMLDNSEQTESHKIIGFNQYIHFLFRHENPDVIVIGVPGGVFTFDKSFHNHFGITNFLVSNAVLPDYVIFCSLYFDTLSKYLEEVTKKIRERYNYEIDQIFLSNYTIDYAASKTDHELTYLTCKTAVIKEKTEELNVFNVYHDKDKNVAMENLIDTLQDYTNLTII